MSFWDDVSDVASDTVTFVEDTAEDVVDTAEDVVDDIGDAAGDVVDGVGDAFSSAADVAGTMVDIAEDAYQTASDVASAVIDPVMDSVVSPVGDAVLGGLEDSGFFDVVDYASLDLIDMSYGKNGFTLDFGIDDIAGYSLNLGNGGVDFHGDLGAQHLGVAWNDNGFDASAALGIDWGPLPYVAGHGSVAGDGNVGAGGEWQGYFPLPGAMVGGHAAGDYQETDDGFRSSWDLTPGVYEPTGEYAGVGTHGSYSEDKDGYQFNVGVHAEAGQDGVVSARGSLDYDEARRGDVRTQGVSASASVTDEITGSSVEGGFGYQHTETAQGDYDSVYVQGHVHTEGVDVGGSLSGTVGPDGSVTVAGAAHVNAGGYEVDGHGSIGVGPDGDVTARGGIDHVALPDDGPQLPDDVPGLPDGIPGLPDGVPGLPDGIPGLPDGVPGLPDDVGGLPLPSNLPDPGAMANNFVHDAVDQGRQAVDDALGGIPAAPSAPAPPALPAIPEPPSLPDLPAGPEVPTLPDPPANDAPLDAPADSDPLPF